MGKKWIFFEDDEVKGLSDELVKKLDQARALAGVPIVITSGLRSSEENESIPDAVQDSSHLLGLAVDIRVYGSQERFRLISALLAVGFRRIGIRYPRHLHVDIDPNKPQNVMW